jgi:transposase
MRKRAAWLPQVPPPHRQDNRPELGKQSASKAHRPGMAERWAAPAGPQRGEVDLALLGHDDALRRDLALAILQAAQQHDANALSLLRRVPGIGASLSLGLLYEMPDSQRFPRGQNVVSSCRLVKCAKESAGPRSGPSGTTSGKASRKWACSEAAVLCLRAHPAGQKSLRRLENKPGKGKALTVLAHKLARAVYDRRQRPTAFDMNKVLTGSRSGASEPGAAPATAGRRVGPMLCKHGTTASWTA